MRERPVLMNQCLLLKGLEHNDLFPKLFVSLELHFFSFMSLIHLDQKIEFPVEEKSF